MASQSLLVVLSPTIVAIGVELGASVGAVGQARTVMAAVAIGASIAIARRIDAIGVPRLLGLGAGLSIAACAAVAASPTLPAFLAAHVVVGAGFACLLSAGFAGVAAFRGERRPRAMGHVAGANGLAWIVVNPVAGLLTDELSWRAAQAAPAAIAVAALLAARLAAPAPGRGTAPTVRTVLGHASARRWIAVEVIAYGSWTALLTFIGAYFIERLGAGEAAVGWFLAAGAGVYFLAATRSGDLVGSLERRRLVAWSALAMAALALLQLTAGPSLGLAVGLFCLIGLAAGIRTPASSGLGLDQLPGNPGAMMSARTAATQLGYLVGGAVGGALIAGVGYAALGVAIAVGMAISAHLVMRVADPRDLSQPARPVQGAAPPPRL